VTLNRSLGSLAKTAVSRPELILTILKGGVVVAPAAALHVGDAVQLVAMPSVDGRLYVLRRDSAEAKWIVTYSADAHAGVSQSVPVALDKEGEIELAVMESRRPLKDSAAIAEARRDADAAPTADRAVRKLRLIVLAKQ
jgi:hypothetical protein